MPPLRPSSASHAPYSIKSEAARALAPTSESTASRRKASFSNSLGAPFRPPCDTDSWTPHSETDISGACPAIRPLDYEAGMYKLTVDLGRYYDALGTESNFAHIEVRCLSYPVGGRDDRQA